MGDLKQHQAPMTIDEQIENLKSIGLVVNDEEYAKRILHILKMDKHWNVFVETLESLIDEYESVNIATMGFPDNWKDVLLNS